MYFVLPPGMVRGWDVGAARLGVGGARGTRARLGRGRRLERGKLADADGAGLSGLKDDEAMPVVVDRKGTVEVLAHLDGGVDEGMAVRLGWDLQGVSVKGDGVVTHDFAGVFESEDLGGVQVFRPGAKGGRRVGGGTSEARVVGRQVIG